MFRLVGSLDKEGGHMEATQTTVVVWTLSLVTLAFGPAAGAAPRLEKAFVFGARNLSCPVFNDPGSTYEVVLQESPEAIQYDPVRGWGYQVFYPQPATQLYGDRGGYGRFGPMDDSPNDRTQYGWWNDGNLECPLAIYDSYIGAKMFLNPCYAGVTGDPLVPCSEVDPVNHPAEGIVFRVDVPNGKYRFVMAVGCSTHPHAHRILVEDGSVGTPAAISDRRVVVVRNFDQAEYCPGTFARVGFGCFIPPIATSLTGNRLAFVNIGADGMPTAGGPESPVLEVTQGWLRVHCLQANSNDGVCANRDPNGGDLVVLEIWEVGEETIEVGPFPPHVVRTVDHQVFDPGQPVNVTLEATGVSVPTLLRDMIPAGFSASGFEASGGVLQADRLSFTIASDGQVSYQLTADGCVSGFITGTATVQGPVCAGIDPQTAIDPSPVSCSEGLTAYGAVREFLMIGPVNLPSWGCESSEGCFGGGRLDQEDYLTDGGLITEQTILAREGDEWSPDFGGAAASLGVQVTPNGNNPNAASGIVTVWRGAVCDAEGHVDFRDRSNYGGAFENVVQYLLVYLDNTTGACKEVILEVGSDDGMVLMVNGVATSRSTTCHNVQSYNQGVMAAAVLAPDKNVILMKVSGRCDAMGARLVVRHGDGTPITDGSVIPSLDPPPAYPVVPGFKARRYLDLHGRHEEGDEIRVTVVVTETTTGVNVVETIPWNMTVSDPGDGTMQEDTVNQIRTLSLTFAGDATAVYTLKTPDQGCDCEPQIIRGLARATEGCFRTPVIGEDALRCVFEYPDCFGPPAEHPEAELRRAFAFGVHPELDPGGMTGRSTVWCESPNAPGVPYTAVEQADRVDAGGAVIQAGSDYLAYEGNEGRGWGFLTLYPDTSVSPFGDREGWGGFGPMDGTPNDRNIFSYDGAGASCAEDLYDSFMGAKDWVDLRDPLYPGLVCDEQGGAVGVPCSELDPTWPLQGIIFRVDVPNGLYRFVLAAGSPDNRHAHRILAEDGGTGWAGDVVPGRFVTLVHNFDQAQYGNGEVSSTSPGVGVYARVGFDRRMPPLGDNFPPDPQFVNMDANGKVTTDCASSPTLLVTHGYILFHCLQASNISGCGGPRDPAGNGSDIVLLEIWQIPAVAPDYFKRGDANRSGSVNLADAIYVLQNLFVSGPPILCPDAADANDDEGVNLADAIYILQNLFTDGAAIPAPGPHTCGPDMTPHPVSGLDLLSCDYCPEACQEEPTPCPLPGGVNPPQAR